MSELVTFQANNKSRMPVAMHPAFAKAATESADRFFSEPPVDMRELAIDTCGPVTPVFKHEWLEAAAAMNDYMAEAYVFPDNKAWVSAEQYAQFLRTRGKYIITMFKSLPIDDALTGDLNVQFKTAKANFDSTLPVHMDMLYMMDSIITGNAYNETWEKVFSIFGAKSATAQELIGMVVDSIVAMVGEDNKSAVEDLITSAESMAEKKPPPSPVRAPAPDDEAAKSAAKAKLVSKLAILVVPRPHRRLTVKTAAVAAAAPIQDGKAAAKDDKDEDEDEKDKQEKAAQAEEDAAWHHMMTSNEVSLNTIYGFQSDPDDCVLEGSADARLVAATVDASLIKTLEGHIQMVIWQNYSFAMRHDAAFA